LVRKAQIPALAEAYKLIQQGQPQWKAAAEFKVDERELRDFAKFKVGKELYPHTPIMQMVIDSAYAIYVDSGLKYSFSTCMEKAADYYGLNPRQYRELWETDPAYYPSGFRP